MNTQPAQRQWFNDIVAQNTGNITETTLPWLSQTRTDARQAINVIALPERKQEAWRYSDLARLYKQDFHYQDIPSRELQDGTASKWIYAENESYRLVFANGRFVPELSTDHVSAENIRIGSLQHMLSTEPEQVSRWLETNRWQTPDVFTELNRALISDGVYIHIPENMTLDLPVEVVYLNSSSKGNALAQPHSLVILEAGAQAKVIEHFTGTDSSTYFFNGITNVSLGANASLQHYRLQNESNNAHHLSRVALRQDSASEYSGINIATGAAWGRTDINARFEGQHARCDLDGLYTVGEQQYTDFHLDVVHSLPHCSSRENFKGIVYGKGRAVFDGSILVEKDAQKTDAQLSNKNLLLTSHAEVDTKPQLEIHADDVKCSHGTTVGKLDPNQLFYLRSRGIDAHQARKMICLGFAEQVLAHVEDEKVHDYIHNQIAAIFGQQDNLP
jgi:Fe-S cluster assembly protein SufD